jgi:hypothetical protein
MARRATLGLMEELVRMNVPGRPAVFRAPL